MTVNEKSGLKRVMKVPGNTENKVDGEHLKVLIIEDNPVHARLIREMIARTNGSVELHCADRLSNGLTHLSSREVDLVLLDLSLPDSQGLDTLYKVKAQAPEVPIVILSALNEKELAIEAIREGAQDYLVKGQVDSNSLYRAVRYAIERKRIQHALNERMKELQCLYSVANIAATPDITLDQLYQQVCHLLPQSWQYPEITCARIAISGKEFKAENYKETEWKQSSDITVHGERAGIVEVCYLEARPEIDEGPFLKEERLLIDAVAEWLGRITERNWMEEELKNSEERLKILFELAPDAYYLNDLQGNFVGGNKAAEKITGYKRGELIGKNFLKLKLLPPRQIPKAAALLAKNVLGQPTGPDEFVLDRKDGSQVTVEISTVPVKIEGQVLILGIARDVSERKRMQDTLKESEAQYRELAESISDVFFAFDEDLKYTYWNKASEKLTGIPAKDALGKHLYDIFPDSEQMRRAEKAYKKVLRTRRPLHFLNEYQLEGKDFSFEISAYPSKSGLSVFVKDVTGSKRVEKRWWDSMSNFHKVITNIADGIIITNSEGIVRFVNPAAESLFGRKREDLQGTQFGFPITSGDTTEIDIIRKAGEIVVAEMRVVETMWYDEIAYLASLRDITERKQVQQIQESCNLQLQAQVNELETFSYGIAHDLRSPLLIIEGFSRLLREDIQNQKMERVQEDIRLLESGVRKMQQFLNRTLEYSRAGHLVKRTKNVSFGKIVEELIAEFNGQMSSIGATVSIAETFPRVYADSMRIRQMLTNLIQNSINYRDKTIPLKIEIGYWLSKDEVVFFVRDNGLGIDASETEKVFALFYRGTADGDGSGAGLAIVKRIIEAHGGRIWAQGQQGKGTTMCFTLPQQGGNNKGDNNGKG